MENLPKAVVAGHICLDIIPDFNHLAPGQFLQIFQPGHLILAGPAVFSTGGPVSNTGLALHKLGIPTQLIGKIGADPFGQAILDVLRTHGGDLADGMLVDPTCSSSYTLIINPPGVDRIFISHLGANDTFCADDIPCSQLEAAHLFHFGYPPVLRHFYENNGQGLVEMYRRAKATGVTTSLDMTFPDPNSPGGQADWRTICSRAFPFVDLFLPSLEEMLFMLHRPVYERLVSQAGRADFLRLVEPELLSEVSSELLEMGAKIVLLKLGERGAYLRTAAPAELQYMGRAAPQDSTAWGDQELWAPCFKVQVVGTTGSGDATIAGFLSGLLRGLTPEQALIAAVAVGACNVEAVDALGGLRTWEATMARIAAGWEQRPLRLSSPGWEWDEGNKLWRKLT